MTIINKKIAERMKKFRIKKGITQEEAAFRSKLDYSYYNQLENGKRNPSVAALNRIVKVLGVSLKELFN